MDLNLTFKVLPWLAWLAIGGAQLLGAPFPIMTGLGCMAFGILAILWELRQIEEAKLAANGIALPAIVAESDCAQCAELERSLEDAGRIMRNGAEASQQMLEEIEALKHDLTQALEGRTAETQARIEVEGKLARILALQPELKALLDVREVA